MECNGWCELADAPCDIVLFCIDRDGEEAQEELFGGVRFCEVCAERWKVEPCPVFHGVDEQCPYGGIFSILKEIMKGEHMKRKRRQWPWIKCSHVTILPSGKRLYCRLDRKHKGVHESVLMGSVITWGIKEPNKRWE